jgi:hypothetical protein
MGRAFVNLWLITGDPEFRARAEKLANDLRGQIRTDQGAAAWPYWNIPSYRNGVVDISHGQLDVDFIFQCHRAGITFTRDEVNRIVRTFRRSTLRDERGRLRGWTNFIDGTGKKLNFREGSLDFWSRLAQLDPEIARTLWEGMPFYRQVQPMRMAGLLMMGCTRFRFDPVLCAERSDGPGGSPGLAGAAGCP